MNHLSHFLLVNLLLEDLQKSPGGKPRCVIVGSGAVPGRRVAALKALCCSADHAPSLNAKLMLLHTCCAHSLASSA